MMNEIILNLELASIGACLFLMAYTANVLLGAWRNVKIDGCDFDWMKIANSCLKSAVLIAGIAMLSIVVSVIPYYVSFTGIEVSAELMAVVDGLIIIGSFLTATIKYAADGISKLKEILGV